MAETNQIIHKFTINAPLPSLNEVINANRGNRYKGSKQKKKKGARKMKAVMISIQPKWVEKIVNGEKTIEVRKTAPKLETPFKGYMYCTNDRKYKIATFEFADGWHIKKYDDSTNYACGCTWRKREDWNGKVVGEFACSEIDKYSICGMSTLSIKTSKMIHRFFPSIDSFDDYLIFDDDYEKMCLTSNEVKEYGNGRTLYGLHISDLKIYDEPKELIEFKNLKGEPIKRAFQSWGYVEI